MELLTTENQKNIKTFIANSWRVLINTKSRHQNKYKTGTNLSTLHNIKVFNSAIIIYVIGNLNFIVTSPVSLLTSIF